MRDIRFFSSILWQEEQDFWTSSLVMGNPSSSGFSSLAGVSAFFCSCPRTRDVFKKSAIPARETTNPTFMRDPGSRRQGIYHKLRPEDRPQTSDFRPHARLVQFA